MSFSEVSIQDNIIILHFPNDKYNNFLRCHYWLEKLLEYDCIPNIIEIDYFQKRIKTQFTNISNKTFKEQLNDIEIILHNNNCQLNSLSDTHIHIWKKTIYILNFEWCIDLSININKEINVWEPIPSVLRSKFIDNKIILNNILKKKGIDFRFDNIIMVFFMKDLNTFKNNYSSISILLNYCNYLIINEEIDNFELKLELNNYPNIEIIHDVNQNIFDNIELFQYIVKTNKQKQYLLSIHSFQFSTISKYAEEIEKNKHIGMLYEKDFEYIGIYGNLKWSNILIKMCQIYDMDYSCLLEDEKEYIDWSNYNHGDSIQDKKNHWLFEGIYDKNIQLPIKPNCEMFLPRIPCNPNFMIHLDLYKSFFDKYTIKKEYDNEVYYFFLSFFIFQSKHKYKCIKK